MAIEVTIQKVENGYIITTHRYGGTTTVHTNFAEMINELQKIFDEVTT